jgi:hypothetical protein
MWFDRLEADQANLHAAAEQADKVADGLGDDRLLVMSRFMLGWRTAGPASSSERAR